MITPHNIIKVSALQLSPKNQNKLQGITHANHKYYNTVYYIYKADAKSCLVLFHSQDAIWTDEFPACGRGRGGFQLSWCQWWALEPAQQVKTYLHNIVIKTPSLEGTNSQQLFGRVLKCRAGWQDATIAVPFVSAVQCVGFLSVVLLAPQPTPSCQ